MNTEQLPPEVLEKLLKQLAEAERLLRAIRNDWQTAHWHKDIDNLWKK